MLEILKFVFSSFWIWLGSFLMLGIILLASIDLMSAFFSGLRRLRSRNDDK